MLLEGTSIQADGVGEASWGRLAEGHRAVRRPWVDMLEEKARVLCKGLEPQENVCFWRMEAVQHD